MKNKVAIVGLGRMGSAIAKSLLKASYEVHGHDTNEDVQKEFKNYKNKLVFHKRLESLIAEGLPVILAVKPSLVKKILAEIDDNRLVISIAAGVSIGFLNASRTKTGPIVRAMPNTPLQIGQGITCLIENEFCTDAEKDFTYEIFETGGDVVFLDSESKMHAVTALSGSGPAFLYLVLQALEDGGVLMGLPRELARQLVMRTASGAASLQKKTNASPQELIHEVTSPGGTTVQGLKILKKFGVENAIQDAIRFATERSLQISRALKAGDTKS